MKPVFLPLLFGTLVACPAPSPDHPRSDNPRRAGPDAPADLVRDALAKNLRQYRRRLRRCHELAMAEDYRVGGRLLVELGVRPMGVVTRVRVRENTSGNALLAACVRRVVLSFVFPSGEADRWVPLKLRFRRPAVKLTVRMGDVPARARLAKGVMAKVLLHPGSVTGSRVSLVVLKLASGARIPMMRHLSALGVHVLRGAMRVTGGQRTELLRMGESAAIGAGVAHGLEAAGTSGCAALLFFMPAGPEGLFLTGKIPRSSSRVSGRATPARGSVLMERAMTTSGSAGVILRGERLPVPQVIQLPAGRSALLNPAGRDVHHALLVTEGALFVTIRSVKLPAEAGMSVYVPGGERALLAPAGGRPARLVVQPWPGKGGWSGATVYPLLRRSRGSPGSGRGR